jgi:ADP-ribosylglycohydrolase
MSSAEVRYELGMPPGQVADSPPHPEVADGTLHPVVSSALWAAWGDALGFITELTTSLSEVSRRSGGAKVENTVSWRRRLGGRFGPMVELPAGTYSDDTQLRLAVSRSIRANGRFDVEAFSKIELPVFLSYELRAGRGTKAAAYELMKRHVRWSSNFFANDRAIYFNAGGNGAAMRIQPHVWSAPGHAPRQFMGWVAADAIITHGHPRGVVGAVIHANALSSVLRRGQVPDPEVWPQIVEYADAIPDLMREHEALRDRWLPLWESGMGKPWREAVDETIAEGKAMVAEAQRATHSDDREAAYLGLVTALGGKRRETAGSGMIAAVASLAAAWLYRDDAVAGLRMIVNQLGTDTDTIATMTGALLGATGLPLPPGPLLDSEYIVAEAQRMASISDQRPTTNFPHPDPLKWRPPSSLADAVGTTNGGLGVAGLGPVRSTNGQYEIAGKSPTLYQWLTLAHGQTILIKRRPDPKPLPATALPRERPSQTPSNGSAPRQAPLFDEGRSRAEASAAAEAASFDAALERVIASGFDERVVGREILSLSPTSVAQAAQLASAVAAAYRASTGR